MLVVARFRGCWSCASFEEGDSRTGAEATDEENEYFSSRDCCSALCSCRFSPSSVKRTAPGSVHDSSFQPVLPEASSSKSHLVPSRTTLPEMDTSKPCSLQAGLLLVLYRRLLGRRCVDAGCTTACSVRSNVTGLSECRLGTFPRSASSGNRNCRGGDVGGCGWVFGISGKREHRDGEGLSSLVTVASAKDGNS